MGQVPRGVERQLAEPQNRRSAGDLAAQQSPDACGELGQRDLSSSPDFARALVLEALATTDAVRARRRRGLEQFAETLTEGLRRVRGNEGQDVPDGDAELTIAALGGVNELCVQHLGRFEAQTLPAVGPIAQRLLESILLTVAERG